MNAKQEHKIEPIELKQQTDPEVIRAKLIQVCEEWVPKLPDLLKNLKAEDMTSKMLINTFRPFLPRFSVGLTNAIEVADQENLLKLVEFVDGVAKWLKEE